MLANAILESTNTTGTGTYDLTAGTDPLFQTFVSGVGSGTSVRYRVEMSPNWEEGYGIVTAGYPDTLTRAAVTASSNSNAAVNWGAGTKRIFCPVDAQTVRFGAAGSVPVATGTANAHLVAHGPAMRALRPGMSGRYFAPTANSGNVTVSFDSITAVPLRRANGTEIAAGVIKASSLIHWYAHTATEARLAENVVGNDPLLRIVRGNGGYGGTLALGTTDTQILDVSLPNGVRTIIGGGFIQGAGANGNGVTFFMDVLNASNVQQLRVTCGQQVFTAAAANYAQSLSFSFDVGAGTTGWKLRLYGLRSVPADPASVQTARVDVLSVIE